MPVQSSPAMEVRFRGGSLRLDTGALIMGVLNVTPDSFSDGGRYFDCAASIDRAVVMAAEGAAIIDVGGESTRPGAEPVSLEEELRRVIPTVRGICRAVRIPVSVDTTKAEVARRALDEGAAIVNDVSALQADPDMAGVVASSGAGVVLMHRQGTPRTMQEHPVYDDVVAEVRAFLDARMHQAIAEGIAKRQILLDPGIGFGKNRTHNLTLLARLDELTTIGRPVVIGVSRKAFIGEVVNRSVGERVLGTAGAVAVAVLRGAMIVRVHDVGPIRDVVAVVEAIRQHGATS